MKIKPGVTWILGLVLVFACAMPFAYYQLKPDDSLPVFQPSQLNPKLVDKSVQRKNRNHKVADFSLLNQDGNTLTQADFAGKIYVTDFFFTTCQSICPRMSTEMSRLNEEYADDPEVLLLSHTVQPEVDSVAVLAAYAAQYGAKTPKWNFVTGSKEAIYDLARKSYFVVTTEGDGGESDFIHTENFVLVDKDKQLRGFYDGTSPDDVDRLMDDIEKLKEEYEEAAEAAKTAAK